MKTLILLILVSTVAFAQQKGTFTDTRDKKKYSSVKIGEQTWMAENLNYASKNSVCYDNKPANCTKYGRLYQDGGEADICPDGWHTPNITEWTTLINALGSSEATAAKLKAKNGWNDYEGKSGNGTDNFGFSLLPGGYAKKRGTEFYNIGTEGYVWLSGFVLYTHSSLDDFRNLDYEMWVNWNGEISAPVRCILDNEEVKKAKAEAKAKAAEEARIKAEEEAKRLAFIKTISGTVTDARDKKKYKTVKIGEQVWMAENLNYAAPGSKCGSAAPKKKYIEARNDTLFYYALEDKNTATCDKYGRLYSRETAMKACPKGFYLPTDEEWEALIKAVGRDSAGVLLKSKTEHNGIDKYGFAALPGGNTKILKEYDLPLSLQFDGKISWWSASENPKFRGTVNIWKPSESVTFKNDTLGYSKFSIESYDPKLYNEYFAKDDSQLLSVRCVDDARKVAREAKEKAEADRLAKIAANIKANSGTMTDARDKKTYKTIKIGTQTWMAQNLEFNAKNSKCWGEKPENCTTYGKLYDWENAKSACPAGWRLPNDADWELLTTTAGGKEIAGAKLKARSSWNNVSYDKPGNGEDEFGFAGLAGGRADTKYNGMGQQGCYWSFNEKNATNGNYRRMIYSAGTFAGIDDAKTSRFSVRCVQGASPVSPAAATGTGQPAQPQQAGQVGCNITFPKKACVSMPNAATCTMSGGKVVAKCP